MEKDEIKSKIYETLRCKRNPMSANEISKEISVSSVTVKKKLTALENEDKVMLIGTLYLSCVKGSPYYIIKDPLERYSITEFDVKDYIDQPIWDNVWKEWLILYRHPDYRDLYLQRANNESIEFVYVKDRYYTNKIEE